MKLCPECRARVLDDWSACKFCGEPLAADAIGATLHPDELVVPDDVPVDVVAPPALSSFDTPPAPPAFDTPPAASPWDDPLPAPPSSLPAPPSSWDDAGWESDVPEPTGTVTQGAWDTPRSDDAFGGYGGDPGTAIEPLEGAGSAEWIAGPAPGESPAVAEGPSGLDPVSWYTEPTQGEAPAPPPPTPPDAPSAPLFDPTTLYDDPADPTPHTAPPPPEPGNQIAPVFNFQPAADGWASEDRTDLQTLKGQPALSREVRLLALGILLFALVAIVYNVLGRGDDSHPSSWPSELTSIAAYVSKDRGIEFKHPVPVDILNESDYQQALANSANVGDKDAAQQFADLAAAYRSLGLISGTPDAKFARAVLAHKGDGVFYNLSEKRLVVRGGSMSTQDQASAARALSIALDDQWFDLDELRKTVVPDSPLLAAVAGTADLVGTGYVNALSKSTSKTPPVTEATLLGPDADADDFLAALTSAPARLGPPFAQAVRDVQGIKELNKAIEVPATSDKSIFQPPTFMRGASPLSTNVPALPPGAKEISEGSFGTTGWYLLLSSRIDTTQALDAVDGWGGDSALVYRRPDNVVCTALTVRGVNGNATSVLLAALQSWKSHLPAGRDVTVTQEGNDVKVEGCDPGADAEIGDVSPAGSNLSLPVLRSRMAAMYYQIGTTIENGPNGAIITYDEAWCIADRMVRRTDVAGVVKRVLAHDDFYAEMVLKDAKACGSTLAYQFFQRKRP